MGIVFSRKNQQEQIALEETNEKLLQEVKELRQELERMKSKKKELKFYSSLEVLKDNEIVLHNNKVLEEKCGVFELYVYLKDGMNIKKEIKGYTIKLKQGWNECYYKLYVPYSNNNVQFIKDHYTNHNKDYNYSCPFLNAYFAKDLTYDDVYANVGSIMLDSDLLIYKTFFN